MKNLSQKRMTLLSPEPVMKMKKMLQWDGDRVQNQLIIALADNYYIKSSILFFKFRNYNVKFLSLSIHIVLIGSIVLSRLTIVWLLVLVAIVLSRLTVVRLLVLVLLSILVERMLYIMTEINLG